MSANYAFLDWLVFASYGAILLLSGWWFNRKRANSSQDFFLGGNSMPTWMVAISVLATSQSAATFIGGPDQGYQGDFSYIATNIGAFIAAFIVSAFLIPKFYQQKVYTVYELLEKRIGPKAKRRSGLMYLFGRVFASGARLYMAAIAVAMILYGNIDADSVVIATLVLALAGLLYTFLGGIRSVIYSDVLQSIVYVSAAIAVIWCLLNVIPADFSTIIATLSEPSPGADSKLALFKFDLDFGPSGVFNMASVLTGFVLLNIAAFGLDQDMTQRLLTCKSPKEGSKALLLSVVMVIPVMAIFIFIGEKITIFMYYVLNEVPAGVKGLVSVGIIAAAISTLNSGLSSMSSVIVQDIYRPYLEKHNKQVSDHHFVKAGRVGMALVSLALALMAILCYFWQQYSDMPLLKFALSVMVFSYSGLLGVYFTTLFTKRGSEGSVLAALIAGFVVTLLMQPYMIDWLLPESMRFYLGFTWQLCIGTLLATLVCCLGKAADEKSA